jgi:hypothetical protein
VINRKLGAKPWRDMRNISYRKKLHGALTVSMFFVFTPIEERVWVLQRLLWEDCFPAWVRASPCLFTGQHGVSVTYRACELGDVVEVGLGDQSLAA